MRIAFNTSAVAICLAVLVACGAGAPGGGGGPEGPGGPGGARSASCPGVSGIPALYWDYMNGIIRADYPESSRTIPYVPGGSYFHPQQPLYNFIVPAGWQAFTLADPGTQLMGVNTVRNDNVAIWRRLNVTLAGQVSAQQALSTEIGLMRDGLGLTGTPVFRCNISAGTARTAALVDFDGFTANITTQAFPSGGTTVMFVQVAIAPQAEYAAVANGIFFPLSAQMLGGTGGTPECRDGEDNDGDGKVDFPADPECSGPDDDSEAG